MHRKWMSQGQKQALIGCIETNIAAAEWWEVVAVAGLSEYPFFAQWALQRQR